MTKADIINVIAIVISLIALGYSLYAERLNRKTLEILQRQEAEYQEAYAEGIADARRNGLDV